jgi:acyl carrier protein
MDRDTILSKVQGILEEQSGLAEIAPDKKLVELGFDSLDTVEIVILVEEEFAMEVSDEDSERLQDGTVNELVTYIEGRLKEG